MQFFTSDCSRRECGDDFRASSSFVTKSARDLKGEIVKMVNMVNVVKIVNIVIVVNVVNVVNILSQ